MKSGGAGYLSEVLSWHHVVRRVKGVGHSEQGSRCGVLYLEAVCSIRFTFVGLLFLLNSHHSG